MKLLTIGDSSTHGVMSVAAARTDLCFSTLVARALGADPYVIPEWPAGGLPFNLEMILRRLAKRFGSDIRYFEWAAAPFVISAVMDEAEDYYERGDGRPEVPYGPHTEFFHNIAVRGYTVADAWTVSASLARETVEDDERRNESDKILGAPSRTMYRVAQKVLNPSNDPRYESYTQLAWVRHHAENEGLENLIVWLGANNALGTVLNLKVQRTPGDPARPVHELPHEQRERAGWNLWHPRDFEREYAALIERLDAALAANRHEDWRVFVGNVPHVTVIPLVKGVGESFEIDKPARGVGAGRLEPRRYFKHYTYVPFEEEFALKTGYRLTMQDAMYIDDAIDAYNASIDRLVDEANQRHGRARYVVVDINDALARAAWKRNGGKPTYDFPEAVRWAYPPVNTKYYHADPDGRFVQGGLFSLDGVHPSAIGQGLLAHECLRSFEAEGRGVGPADLDWDAVFRSDTLYQDPIPIMQELRQHEELATRVINLIRLVRG